LANELLTEYADRMDGERYDEWVEVLTEDARYDAVPRENVDNFSVLTLLATPLLLAFQVIRTNEN
jgi:hypothetical protein